MTDRLVVAAVLVDDLERPTRVLAARRSRPPALAGRWELPGGKVEPGEAPVAALRRELDEELGVAVRVGRELVCPDGPAWPLTRGLVMRTWWCELATGAPQIGEAHDALQWVGTDDIACLDWLEPDRPIVALIAADLGPTDPAAT